MMMSVVLAPLAPTANARFICSKGTTQAAPACHRCHGQAARTAAQPSRTPCCRVVIDPAPAATASVTQTTGAPPTSFSAVAPAAMSGGALSAVTGAAVEFPPRPGPRFQASTTILRL
jgi:hypothetical protein